MVLVFCFLAISVSGFCSYKEYMQKGNAAYSKKQYQKALSYYLEAYAENPNPKLKVFIKKLKAYVNKQSFTYMDSEGQGASGACGRYDKNPWLAFFIAALTLPGFGSWYAENNNMALLLGGIGVAGFVLTTIDSINYWNYLDNMLTAEPPDRTIYYIGAALISATEILDAIAAVIYVNNMNHKCRTYSSNELKIYPGLIENNPGLCMSVKF